MNKVSFNGSLTILVELPLWAYTSPEPTSPVLFKEDFPQALVGAKTSLKGLGPCAIGDVFARSDKLSTKIVREPNLWESELSAVNR